MRGFRTTTTTAILALAVAAQPAFAQDESDDTQSVADGGAIVVTAQRREQNLQDIPLAVSAIGTEALVRQEADTTEGLLRLFPNVSGAQITGAGANNYSIRGLSNAETAATFDSPVGTYIDGIYLSRVNSNNFALFDVERIEILRGPQGTLFGRNTTGGAVNVVLKKPGSDLGGSAEVSYGSYDRIVGRAALDLPLSDNVRTRVAAYVMEEDGFVKNLTTGGTNNDHDGWGVRGSVSWDITPNLTWDGSVDYIEDENSFIPSTKVDGDWVSNSGLMELGDIVTGEKGSVPGNRVINETLGLTSRFTLDVAPGVISFITGYRNLDTAFNLDYFDGPSEIGGFDSVQVSNHKQFTQEINIAGTGFDGLVDYTAGFFYFTEKNDTDYTTVFRLGSGFPFIGFDRTIYNDTDSMAFYGQFDWHLTPELTLTTGGRWTHDRKSIDYENNGNPLALTAVTNDSLLAAGIPLKQNSSVFTPRVALSYEAADDLMFFASATRGFKSGGWNVRATNVTELGDFLAETIWSFEGGMRSQLLDRLLTFNLTGFYGYTKNLQIATAVGTAVSSAPVFPVGNFSDFRSYGLEAELNATPAEGLNLFANAGWNKTEYANPTDAVLTQQANCVAAIDAGTSSSNCGNGIVRLDGTIAEPLRAPEFTGTLGFSYAMPLTSEWNLVPSGSVRYVSSFNVNSAQLATTYDDGYTLVAGSLAVESWDQKMRFSIGCENCTDTNYLVSVIAGYSYYSPPRRWTARARFSF